MVARQKELHILIVDDDDIDRECYMRNLKSGLDATVVVYEGCDCEEAKRYLEKEPIDCLLIDYNLPGCDGISFLKTLKAQPRYNALTVILLTGQGSETLAVDAMKYGADDYLNKSDISPERLSHAITSSLEKNMLRKKLYEKYDEIDYMAHHDMMTRCLNRYTFVEFLEKNIKAAERHDRKGAILFVDLDHFKYVNDHFGHDVGDLLLIEVTQRIQKNIRSSDIIARIGGDEFLVCLSEINSTDDATHSAQKIINALSKPYNINEKEVNVTPSIGVACYPDDADDSEKLIQYADLAMYQAKKMGRHGYQFFSSQLLEQHRKKMGLERDLNVAIDREQFFLVYQPQYLLANKTLDGLEALLRWKHPKEGLIFPDRFIQIAEKNGMINEIGAWVLKSVYEQYKLWREKNNMLPKVAVNVSPRQLNGNMLFDNVSALFTQGDFLPSQLELEITETALVLSTGEAIDLLATLKSWGVDIAIDDFGTGYSSLVQLANIRSVSTLKIDKSFINNIEKDQRNTMMTKSVIDIGHNLELSLVAEGVETDHQLHYLEQCRCDKVQGFLFQKPLLPKDVESLFHHTETPLGTPQYKKHQ